MGVVTGRITPGDAVSGLQEALACGVGVITIDRAMVAAMLDAFSELDTLRADAVARAKVAEEERDRARVLVCALEERLTLAEAALVPVIDCDEPNETLIDWDAYNAWREAVGR